MLSKLHFFCDTALFTTYSGIVNTVNLGMMETGEYVKICKSSVFSLKFFSVINENVKI